MIIYSGTVARFAQDVYAGVIADRLEELFLSHHLGRESMAERSAWLNSLGVMDNVLRYSGVASDVPVAIEYRIPYTAKRVDFLIAGIDEAGRENVVTIELKQWESAEVTELEHVVRTYVGGALRAVAHPSQQILAYCQLITNFNLTVREEDIRLRPCAFLHNYVADSRNPLEDARYTTLIEKAPLFYMHDRQKIGAFIRRFIKRPAERDIFTIIDHGRLCPSKALQDAVAGLLAGNEAFAMVDEQQVAYATVLAVLRKRLAEDQKYTIIIEGGPGTGKSVIAVQLLARLLQDGRAVAYVTKNSAPRNVFAAELLRHGRKLSYIRNLFKSPVSFEHLRTENALDCLLIDEAHRLMRRYGNNQIDDLIRSAKVSVFFIDEDQRVTTKDIGTKEEIERIAMRYGSRIVSDDALHLVSQFRCNGSDGYLAFLDQALGLRKTVNISPADLDYDLRIYDDPVAMRDALREKNLIANKARMLAGYCYEWVTRDDLESPKDDIVLPNGFRARWNFRSTGTWAIDPDSFEQVGCIHTSQGLEFDYCGVIIGPDLRYEDGRVTTHQEVLARSDQSSGIRSCPDPLLADRLIRNTYKTLLSRGQKGCYIYCTDPALAAYFRQLIRSGQ